MLRFSKLTKFVCVSLFTTLALAACSFDPTSEDLDEAASELTPAWFAENLPEGSRMASAVLAVANDRNLSADEYIRKVRITREAALSIVGYRDGDELADTSDDQRFDSLAELDALPFTNAAFWDAMINYARLDAGPRPDGGVSTDGGAFPRDAGPPQTDASAPPRDAGPHMIDGGSFPRDAAPIRDAAFPRD